MSAVAISWCGLAIFHSHDDAIRPAKPSRSLPHAALRGFFLLKPPSSPPPPAAPAPHRASRRAWRSRSAPRSAPRPPRRRRRPGSRRRRGRATRRRQKAASSGSPKRGDVDVEEIGALRRDHRRSRALARPAVKRSRLRAKSRAHALEIGVVLGQPVGDGGLQVRRRREGEELVRLGEHAHDRRGAAQTKPTFQPVRLKILPAEPILTVRSRMPGSAISGWWRRPSKTTCSQTSSQTAMASWRTQKSASSARSSSREDRRRRVERIVEQHDLGFRRERPAPAPPR